MGNALSVISSYQKRKPLPMHSKLLGDPEKRHLCAWAEDLQHGQTLSSSSVRVFVALLQDQAPMETSGRITFIGFMEAGLSGQQWYHPSVDLSSAPLTFDYVLALKRRRNKSHDLALFSRSHLISDRSLG
ncbi:Hypothetical predicted protein [Xyrichtys novacula]|uniref:Uncharacterized protein n=1 Tax=Xyrichtys novacula TaxID=13765 RepID=A0AAV1H3Y3_XYRNO|nr:Hypothetical predicted protein [Xyrichtys novacula]